MTLATFDNASILTKFNCHRLSLVAKEDDEGWLAELRHYLKDMPDDVTRDTDIVEWWQVSCYCHVQMIP